MSADLSLVVLLAVARRRAAATRATAKTDPTLSLTPNLTTTRSHRTVTPNVTDKPSTSRLSTLAVEAVRSTVARSRMNRADPTATNKRLRPPATAAVVATSVARSVACRVATSGSPRSAVRASTVKDSTITKRKSKLVCDYTTLRITNLEIGDAVSPTNPRKTIRTTTIQAARIRTKSARRKNARGARKKRRSVIRRNMVVATKTRMTMLTSVVQVLASTGAAHALVSRNTGARRARARLPSATLEATARSAGTVKRARADMVVRKSLVTVARSTDVRKSLVTVARSTDVKSSPITVASKRAPATVANSSLSMDAKSPRAMELTPTALAVTVDVAKVVRRVLVTTGCLVASAVTRSLSKGMAAGRMKAAMAKVATERRATAAGIKAWVCWSSKHCIASMSLLSTLMAHASTEHTIV